MSAYAACRLCGDRVKLIGDGGGMHLPPEWTMHNGAACCPHCSEARPDISLAPRQRGQATLAIIEELQRAPELRAYAASKIEKSKSAPAAARTAVLEALRSKLPDGPLTLLLCDVLTSADWQEVVRVVFRGVETGAPDAAALAVEKLMAPLAPAVATTQPKTDEAEDPFAL